MAQEEIIFPNNIRNIRAAKGMKMTDLARRSNLSLSAVSKIEKGVRRLNQKQLLNVCAILGCKLSDIFIHESDSVADQWQSEIKRRLTDNEDSGLKIFGSGLRKIRQRAEKTIAETAKKAKMTSELPPNILFEQLDGTTTKIDLKKGTFVIEWHQNGKKMSTPLLKYIPSKEKSSTTIVPKKLKESASRDF